MFVRLFFVTAGAALALEFCGTPAYAVTGTAAVSYTHLDVYKRQAQQRPEKRDPVLHGGGYVSAGAATSRNFGEVYG